MRHFRQFIAFIISFLIYNDGILMALDFAAIIGAVLFGMTQTQLILFMILVQVTSAIGAYLFGMLGEKIGFKKALLLSLVLMIVAVVWMIFNPSLTGYFIIGGLAGFALTGVQSLSRTMAGLFAPASKSAEFFGFFAVAGKSSSFIGPATFGLHRGWACPVLPEKRRRSHPGGAGRDTRRLGGDRHFPGDRIGHPVIRQRKASKTSCRRLYSSGRVTCLRTCIHSIEDQYASC